MRGKKLNDDASSTGLVIIVFTSLIFSTVLISWFMLQIYGVSVAGLSPKDMIMTGKISYASFQDFTSNQINQSNIDVSSYGIWSYQEGVGRVLLQKSTSGWSYLLINNIQKDSRGIITNRYHINNSVKQDYTIVLRYTGGSDQNEITITDDGIRFPLYLANVVIGSNLIVPYPDMNKIENVDITTAYDDAERSVVITFNGATYGINEMNIDVNPLNMFGRYYGGIASDTIGFTVEDFRSDNSIEYNPEQGVLRLFGAFLVIAFKLIFWNIDSAYLPIELNFLLIKTQILALVVGLINMRSGS